MSTDPIKTIKKIHQKGDQKSLVKQLIALRPISPIETKQSHPLQTLQFDTGGSAPIPIDQFAPYLSRKLALKRNEQIQRLKGKIVEAPETFVLTNSEKREDTEPKIRSARSDGMEDSSMLAVHLKMEEAFDKIASGSASIALPHLIESTLQVYFLAEKVLFYFDVSSIKVLYCPSTTGYCPHGNGLVGYTQFSRTSINKSRASDHAAYSLTSEGNLCPPDSRVLVFPLFDTSAHVKAVVEVIRPKSSPPFSSADDKFVEYFQSKVKMYSPWLFRPVIDDAFASDLMQTCRLRQFIESIREKLTHLFSCRGAEIWHLNRQSDEISQYVETEDKPIVVSNTEAGIAGYALRKQVPISCISARVHSAYNPKTDGNGDYSVLVIPVRDPDSPLIYALVLRGKRIPQFFTDSDEAILARIAPYVISSLASAELIERNHRALKESMRQQKRLRSLLEIAESLSGQLRMEILIPNIMTKACELTKADRCSLFLVNENRDKLVTSFQGGLSNSIEIPIDKGVVGWTATKGEVLNIKDAYEDSRFSRATDLASGYRTLTILSVPIYDAQKEIRGVTEMINKLEGAFTEEDEKLIQIFNVFCGISIENARLYRASIDLSMQLKSFLDISYSLSQTQTIKKLIEEIIRNTRKVIGAVRALLFMVENQSIVFTPFVMDEDIEAKMKKMQKQKADEAEDNLGVKRAIISKLIRGSEAEYDAETKKEEERRNKIVRQVISSKQGSFENDDQNRESSLMAVPIVSSDRVVLGAVVMQWKKNGQKFTYDDVKLLESYSVFLSISLERSRLKNIAQLGTMEVEIQNWMTAEERVSYDVPQKLSLEIEKVFIPAFNASEYDRIGLFKVIFCIFSKFGLSLLFRIPNQNLFSFLYEVSSSYNAVFYHNWHHAVETAQLLSYIVEKQGLRSKLTDFEILVMAIACICHDANHDGFSNSFNLRAQTPLSILFKGQSVLETHHASVAVGILTKDECNLFSSFSEEESARVWPLFIDLILGTDMGKHFEIIEEAKRVFGNGQWEKSGRGRLIMMEILVKVADLANAAKPFGIADRWGEIMCEEFFRQGDLSKAQGMAFIPGGSDREHLDKRRSMIGFYKYVCLPLFETACIVLPGLKEFCDQIELNISGWTQEIQQKDKQESEEKIMLEEKKRAEAEQEALMGSEVALTAKLDRKM